MSAVEHLVWTIKLTNIVEQSILVRFVRNNVVVLVLVNARITRRRRGGMCPKCEDEAPPLCPHCGACFVCGNEYELAFKYEDGGEDIPDIVGEK